MKRPIEVYIRELRLDGLSPAEAREAVAVFESELTRLLGGGGSEPRAGGRPGEVGAHLARTVYRRIGR